MSEQGPDDEVLAKAHYVAGKQLFGMTEDVLWGGATEHAKQQSRYKARAVVAAYVEQRAARGYIEVDASDLQFILDEFVPDDVIKTRLLAILAAHAPGATEEPI